MHWARFFHKIHAEVAVLDVFLRHLLQVCVDVQVLTAVDREASELVQLLHCTHSSVERYGCEGEQIGDYPR